MSSLLQTNFGTARANEILGNLGLRERRSGPGRRRPRWRRRCAAAATVRFTSPLQFYVKSGMTGDGVCAHRHESHHDQRHLHRGAGEREYRQRGRAGLPARGRHRAWREQLVNYRQSNPNNLTSIAWVIDALGQSYPDALQALEAGDYITTQSYQFTADIAALGPYGRGYRRVKFVFDTSSGTPKIVYRQDLTHLGWALGKEVRQNWVLAKATR